MALALDGNVMTLIHYSRSDPSFHLLVDSKPR